ncbi:MAG: PAS domain S-box protein [Polaromonas sp.]|nr:PAS domain S-box protein [Polaromonas sp.]
MPSSEQSPPPSFWVRVGATICKEYAVWTVLLVGLLATFLAAKRPEEALFGMLLSVMFSTFIWMFSTQRRRALALAGHMTKVLSREFAEHRQTEAELLRFKNVLDNTLDMIFMAEPDTLRFVYLNQGAALNLGYSQQELLGMTPCQIAPFMPESTFRQLIAPLVSGDQSSLRFETVHRRKDGTDFPVSIFLQLVLQSDGGGRFFAIVRDITQDKAAEMFVLAQEQVLELIAGGAPLRQSLEAVVQLVEKSSPISLCSILLVEGQQLHHGAAPNLPDSFTQAIEGLQIGEGVGACGTAAFRKETVVVEDTGRDPLMQDYRELLWAHELHACWSTPVMSTAGDVLATFAIYRRAPGKPEAKDLELIAAATRLARIALEHARAEAELLRFKNVLDNTLDMIFMFDPETLRFVYLNQGAVLGMGYRRDELLGMMPCQINPLLPEAKFRQFIAPLLSGEQASLRYDSVHRRKDGTDFPVAVFLQLVVQSDASRLFVATVRDITDRELITKALHASELQLREMTDTVPAMIAYLDTEQRFCFHNKAYEEVFDLSSGQITGHLLADVLGPKDYERAQTKVDEVLHGYPAQYERIQITPQGDLRNYAMQYFPRYGEGVDEGKVVGFYSLGTDITELKRIDRMKTEFVSTVSHELRTPLTSIRGSLGLIAGGVAGELPEAVKNLVDIAKNNCERLIRLINELLDSEKIESGKMRLDLQVVDIKQLVEQALVSNQGFATQYRVKLVLQAPDELLQVRIDRDRMTQVLTNLLSNAVKFSPPQEAVEVRVTRVAKGVRIEIADHGPGIPEEFRNRIFQKFSQADSSDTRQKGGTGLGLNISKALIEKMGGHIGFSSEAGAGTTFFLEVPEWQTLAPLRQPLRTEVAFVKPRILVCEDDPAIAELISIMLRKAGFEVDTAHSAEQALVCLAHTRYDAMTVDLKLPGQTGMDFINVLRSDEKTRDLPVVVISVMAEEGQLQFKRKPLTVSDWLKKPINEKQLILSVRRAIAGLPSGNPRILHVEDDIDIQSIVAAIVRDFANVEFAATLEQARTRLREHQFDLVLLDLGLGKDSGWDLFEDIDALNPRPPVIVFSASDDDPDDGKQTEAVLLKTHTSNAELFDTIRRVLQISGASGPAVPNP